MPPMSNRSRRIWKLMALVGAALAVQPVQGQPLVCELEVFANSTIQELLQVKCNVSHLSCSCSSEFFENKTWALMAVVGHLAAPPGYWYPTDGNAKCVQYPSEPIVCPPGFFCSGGLEAPRACWKGDHCPGGQREYGRQCPSGFYCHTPAGPMLPCPDGCICSTGSSEPRPCDGGWVCKDGQVEKCPRGFYCPFASAKPKPCHILAICEKGSDAEDLWLLGALFIFGSSLAFYTGARVYKQIIQDGRVAIGVVTVLIFLICLVDLVIAFFIALFFVMVSVNWCLLKLGPCPDYIAQLIFLLTLSAAVLAIFYVNPPWAVLAGAFILLILLGWLMSRGNPALAGLGRFIFLLVLICLWCGYGIVDLDFTIIFLSLNVLLVAFLAVFWSINQRQQVRPLPFPGTAWNEIPFDGDGIQMHISSDRLDGPGGSFLASDTEVGGGGRLSASGLPAEGGVSFKMKGVSYELPDGLKLLHDVDLRIGAGRSVAVMGPSGCGKSTLLSVLSGRASSGAVTGTLEVNGRETSDLAFLRRVTGFVPQDDVLHGELLVEENIRFQAMLRLPSNTDKQCVEDYVQKVAQDLQLVELLQKRVGTAEQRGVSGGQRKRVSIAMELVAAPHLLFADEPTSGLDSTTSHEVVTCLTKASAGKMTVLAVIHQPRYDTLCLFDDLVLLGKGGYAIYGGKTDKVKEYFEQQLFVKFEPNCNPADTLLDVLRPPHLLPEDCAMKWSSYMAGVCVETAAGDEAPSLHRAPQPFVRAVLLFLDRSLRQTLQSRQALFINQGLNSGATLILCTVIKYKKLDQFIMQSAFACLFLMLLQGVAAQRIFGADLLVTWREAQVGMPMIAYFVAKDLAAFFELTLSAIVFSVTYSCFSGAGLSFVKLLGGSWAFLYVVFGLSYIFSLVLAPGSSQMAAVVASFVSFCVSGVYQPQLPEFVEMLGGRGWIVPALSPIRWFWAYMLTNEVPTLTVLSRKGAQGSLQRKGYDMNVIDQCPSRYRGSAAQLSEAWSNGQGWVCSVADMLLLGVLFRFVAGVVFILAASAHTSGWARFFGEASTGSRRVLGISFKVLVASFVILFIVAEVWLFGILDARVVYNRLIHDR